MRVVDRFLFAEAAPVHRLDTVLPQWQLRALSTHSRRTRITASRPADILKDGTHSSDRIIRERLDPRARRVRLTSGRPMRGRRRALHGRVAHQGARPVPLPAQQAVREKPRRPGRVPRAIRGAEETGWPITWAVRGTHGIGLKELCDQFRGSNLDDDNAIMAKRWRTASPRPSRNICTSACVNSGGTAGPKA